MAREWHGYVTDFGGHRAPLPPSSSPGASSAPSRAGARPRHPGDAAPAEDPRLIDRWPSAARSPPRAPCAVGSGRGSASSSNLFSRAPSSGRGRCQRARSQRHGRRRGWSRCRRRARCRLAFRSGRGPSSGSRHRAGGRTCARPRRRSRRRAGGGRSGPARRRSDGWRRPSSGRSLLRAASRRQSRGSAGGGRRCRALVLAQELDDLADDPPAVAVAGRAARGRRG